MSERLGLIHWILGCALAGVLTLFLVAVLSVPDGHGRTNVERQPDQPPSNSHGLPKYNDKKSAPRAQGANADETKADQKPLAVKLITGEKTEAEARKEKYETEEKPDLDRGLTRYTLWLVIFTAMLFVAASIQAGLFVWQLLLIRESLSDGKKSADAAKASAEIAKNSLILSQRPWIEIFSTFIEGSLVFSEDGARLTFCVAIRNVGNTPALNTRITAEVYLTGIRLNVIERQAVLCDEVKKWKDLSGPTMFPAGETILKISIPIIDSEIKDYNLIMPGTNRKIIVPVIIGCVDYTRPVDGESCQTCFAFNLFEVENGAPTCIEPALGNVPAEKLGLSPWVGGGFRAD